MKSRSVLVKGVEVVVFLFAGFSHFLTDIAPPTITGSFSFETGISSFFSLCILLYIASLTKDYHKRKFNKIWRTISVIFFGASVVLSFLYKSQYEQRILLYPNTTEGVTYVIGTVLTQEAQSYQEVHQRSTAQLVSDFGGVNNISMIWVPESIKSSRSLLSILYVSLIIALSTTIFSLTEGILGKYEKEEDTAPEINLPI